MSECHFKQFLDSDCHGGQVYGKRKALETSLPDEEWIELLWKSGQANAVIPENITICKSHKFDLQRKTKDPKCCNPFGINDHTPKGIQ